MPTGGDKSKHRHGADAASPGMSTSRKSSTAAHPDGEASTRPHRASSVTSGRSDPGTPSQGGTTTKTSSGSAPVQRVFPVSSIVSAGGGTPSDAANNPMSPTQPSAGQKESDSHMTKTEWDYFQGIGQSFPAPEQQDGAQQAHKDESPQSSDPTVRSAENAAGRDAPKLTHQESADYVEQLHRQHHEVHAEPDADEIIRRARAARVQHEKRDQASEAESSTGSLLEPLMTARFEHQETEDGHMIITGRADEIKKCEDEVCPDVYPCLPSARLKGLLFF